MIEVDSKNTVDPQEISQQNRNEDDREKKSRENVTEQKEIAAEEDKIEILVPKLRGVPNFDLWIRPSILSNESNHAVRKIIRIFFVILVLANSPLILRNVKNFCVAEFYEIGSVLMEWYRLPLVYITLGLNVFIIFTFILEIMAVRRYISDDSVLFLQILNTMFMILYPIISIIISKPLMASSVLIMISSTSVTMKLISYSHVNHLLRKIYRDNPPVVSFANKLKYPINLNLANLYYFILVPSLCYQVDYPRSDKFKKRFLLLNLGELIILSYVIYVISVEWMLPVLKDYITGETHILKMVGYNLKVSIPFILIWLIGFYVFFDKFLNICAEITMWGDRQFYKEWWNSSNFQFFWSNWNMPVHNWISRHIYHPLLNAKFPKNLSFAICFIVSALYHELIISVAFGNLKIWSFLAMIFQIPLVPLSSIISKKLGIIVGKIFVWGCLILGQSMVLLFYFNDYYIENLSV